MEIADAPEPFLRLAGCFEEIGLPHEAVRLYRKIPRVFGPAAAGRVALPLARASLAAGDVVSTRSRALANASYPGAEPEWDLLLAESSLASGEAALAQGVLARLVRADAAAGREPRTLALLARAALASEPSAATLGLLDAALEGIRPAPGRPAHDLGEALLLTATLHRRVGSAERALALYRRSLELLPAGFRRAEAAYWLARLGGEAVPIEVADGQAPEALARLVESAQLVQRLNRRLGASPPGGLR
jgi:tetratricopeptide (TPR) repeat protein